MRDHGLLTQPLAPLIPIAESEGQTRHAFRLDLVPGLEDLVVDLVDRLGIPVGLVDHAAVIGGRLVVIQGLMTQSMEDSVQQIGRAKDPIDVEIQVVGHVVVSPDIAFVADGPFLAYRLDVCLHLGARAIGLVFEHEIRGTIDRGIPDADLDLTLGLRFLRPHRARHQDQQEDGQQNLCICCS